jgi:hypothetical protein
MSPARNPFAEAPEAYAIARPQYPQELFDWVASNCERHELAWDCATGNGQSAVGLAQYFTRVCATDVSAEQLAHALHRNNISYAVAPAEATQFADDSFDLVAVAQALHWFDYARFWPEVRRVSRREGLFCAWGYDWFQSRRHVDEHLVRPFRKIIEPFWAANNGILWRGYQDQEIAFPFQHLEAPKFEISADWTLSQLIAYMMTWSAYKRSRADANATAEMDALLLRTRSLIPADEMLPIRMPLKVIAGRVS